MKRFIAALAGLFVVVLAIAQSSPNLTFGQVPTAGQWNSYFAGKLDYNLGGLPVASGGTGAVNAAGARTNLGLGTMSQQDASNVNITGGTISGVTVSTTNIGGGALGSVPYQSGPSATTFLAGNTSTIPKFYTSTGTGTTTVAPLLTGSTGTGSVVLSNTPTLTTAIINGFTGDTSVINIGSGQIYKDAIGQVGINTGGAPVYALDVKAAQPSFNAVHVLNASANAASESAAFAEVPNANVIMGVLNGASAGASSSYLSTTAGSFSLKINGAAQYNMDTGGNLLPNADNAQTFGSAAKRLSAIYGAAVNTSTLTATSTVSLSPANAAVTISPSGTGTLTISPAGASTMNNVIIGGTTPAAGTFTTITGTSTISLSPANAAVTISPSGTGTVAISPVGALTINPTAASTINNTSIGVTTPAAAKFSTVSATNLAWSSTAPTISSGFGSSPSIAANNGTLAFTVNVGTGGSATAGVIGMPTASTGWVCPGPLNRTAMAANRANQWTVQTATTTNTVTVQNQTISTGVALAWTASDVLAMSCHAY